MFRVHRECTTTYMYGNYCRVNIVTRLVRRHSQKNRRRLRDGEWKRGVYTRNMQKKRKMGGTKEQ